MKEYIALILANKLIKYGLWLVGFLLVINLCNRQCKSEPVVESSIFDLTAIAMSLPVKDSTQVDTLYAKEDLQKILPSEMIEFAKDHSSLFASYLGKKYVVENGLIVKK